MVSECPGQPGRPYCKRLVLAGAKADDTGYFRCYYRDVKDIIIGTTAVSVYVFVRGESHSPQTHTNTVLMKLNKTSPSGFLFFSFSKLISNREFLSRNPFHMQ